MLFDPPDFEIAPRGRVMVQTTGAPSDLKSIPDGLFSFVATGGGETVEEAMAAAAKSFLGLLRNNRPLTPDYRLEMAISKMETVVSALESRCSV